MTDNRNHRDVLYLGKVGEHELVAVFYAAGWILREICNIDAASHSLEDSHACHLDQLLE